MKSASSVPSDSDIVLGEFLKAYSMADNPQDELERFGAQHPELLEFVQVNRLLDRSQPAATMPPPPEKLGELVLGRCIGAGGMGEIYEAYHERLRRKVAVKIIRRGFITPEARERFVREQLVLAQLHQTHIVPIQSAGEEGVIQYFSMPYVNGASLKHVLDAAFDASTARGAHATSVPQLALQIVEAAKLKPMHVGSESEALMPSGSQSSGAKKESSRRTAASREKLVLTSEYYRSVACLMRDVALAVDHAHGEGVLHRDLKPDNIMVEPNGHAWVIDFGLAGKLSNERVPSVESRSELDGDNFDAKSNIRHKFFRL